MVNSLYVLHQLKVVMENCNENIDCTSNDSVTSLLNSVSNTSPFNNLKFKPSEKLHQNLNTIISHTTAKLDSFFDEKEVFAMKLSNINYIDGNSYEQAAVMNNNFQLCIDHIYDKYLNYNNSLENYQFKHQPFVPDVNEPQLEEINNLMNQILKSVEKLYKKHVDLENDNESDKLLKCLIVQPLSSDLEDCDFITINKQLNNVLKSSLGNDVLRSCHPLLEQYSLLVQYLITQQTMVYRALSKFSYLLSTLFTDLASNVSDQHLLL